MQLIQVVSIKDCQEDDQRKTDVDNEVASMNHMSDLWKSDVVGVSRGAKEKGRKKRDNEVD